MQRLINKLKNILELNIGVETEIRNIIRRKSVI